MKWSFERKVCNSNWRIRFTPWKDLRLTIMQMKLHAKSATRPWRPSTSTPVNFADTELARNVRTSYECLPSSSKTLSGPKIWHWVRSRACVNLVAAAGYVTVSSSWENPFRTILNKSHSTLKKKRLHRSALMKSSMSSRQLLIRMPKLMTK